MESLMSGEFSLMLSTWTEHLCLERAEDQVVLSSRSYGPLAGTYAATSGLSTRTFSSRLVGIVRRLG